MRGDAPSSSNRSLPRQLRKSLGNDGVIVLVSRRATAEQSQGFSSCVPDFVFLPGRNGNGIPSLDLSRLVFDPHASIATSDVIYLLGNPVVMFLGRITRVNARFGQALIPNGGIAMRKQFADFGSVPGLERWHRF